MIPGNMFVVMKCKFLEYVSFLIKDRIAYFIVYFSYLNRACTVHPFMISIKGI